MQCPQTFARPGVRRQRVRNTNRRAVSIRDVTLVLMDADAVVVGRLPGLRVGTPWLQEVAEVCAAATVRLGCGVTILRLLHATPPGHVPRRVSYLAQLNTDPPGHVTLEPWSGRLPEHPRRFEWARPGGPAALLDWARQQLADRGHALQCVDQVRTWNLSAIWRLQSQDGARFWLKCVPPFLAHEGPVIDLLAASAPVPELLARAPGRILMRDIPGEDLWHAPLARLQQMVDTLVALQWHWHDRLQPLRDAGVPMADAPTLTGQIRSVITRNRHALRPGARRRLEHWAGELPRLFDRIGTCGLPDSLVHGDFHPGNWRGMRADDKRPDAVPPMRLMDWGDCVIGHPLLDLTGLLDRVQEDLRPALLASWQRSWQAHVPGVDIQRASDLLWPIATARMASTYQMFLDNIEPSERIYHASDPVDCLHLTAERLVPV